MSKTKILFCMHHIVMGGLEKVLCQYLLELKKDKDIDLCVISKQKITDNYFINFFKHNDIMLIDGIWYEPPKVHFYLFKKLVKIYARFRNMFFIRHLYGYDVYIDFANFSYNKEFQKLKSNKPKIAWCHGGINFFDNYIRHKERLQIYDKIVCLSESFRCDFIKKYPFLANKIVCIYNPIDFEFVQNGSKKRFYKTNGKYFVAVQRLDCDKSVETIIDAFSKISERYKDIKLYVVGDGPLKNVLMNKANGNSNIVFTGQLDDAYFIIKKSLGLILSSTKKVGEGLPNVLLEAQVLGTLTISSDVKSGPAEILLNGKAGYLFDAENSDSLCEVLEYVINHTEENEEKIKIATENLYRFDVKNCVNKLKILINEL